MRYVAAALLVGLAGGDVTAAAIEKILKAAGVDADSAEVSIQGPIYKACGYCNEFL